MGEQIMIACDQGAGLPCRTPGCLTAVTSAPSGRWFITMGHPGYNSPANNRRGYATAAAARAAVRRYTGGAR